MNLYLVRHGDAARVGGAIRVDADRPLTADGERDVTIVADALTRLNGRIAMIWTSPLRRALQTAQILAARLAGPPAVTPTANLAPGFRPADLLADIAASDAATGLVLVGHQPDLGGLLSALVTDALYAAVAFPPGTVAMITLPRAPAIEDATLQWLLTPEALRRITNQQ
jgi:phosphohistidine phosphatase